MLSAEITLERSIYVGNLFASVLYGIYIALYYSSFRQLWKQSRTKKRIFYLTYSSVLLVFLTIAVATNCVFGDLMWIDDRNIPGGPPAYYRRNISAWYNVFGSAADVAVCAMADGLLLYRCIMFWSDHRWLVILPALIYVSTIVMGISMTIESAVPGADIFQGTPEKFGVSWITLTVSFNIIVTTMIIGRLLITYWRVRRTLHSNFSTTYISVSATLAESALPLTVFGLGYLICAVSNSNMVFAFSFVWGTYAALAPQFIIYRVATGIAWTKDTTFETENTIQFTSNLEEEIIMERTPSTRQSSKAGSSTLTAPSLTYYEPSTFAA